MALRIAKPEFGERYQTGGALLVLIVSSLAAALAFEYVGGYRPCPLCLMQRWAYWAAIPMLFLALVAVAGDMRGTAGFLFTLVALAFLANAGLGIYHAGAEWGFWPGPDTCATAPGAASTSTTDLLRQLQQSSDVVRCDRAPWRLFGLSFAGWNVVISAIVFAASLRAALLAPTDQRSRPVQLP